MIKVYYKNREYDITEIGRTDEWYVTAPSIDNPPSVCFYLSVFLSYLEEGKLNLLEYTIEQDWEEEFAILLIRGNFDIWSVM